MIQMEMDWPFDNVAIMAISQTRLTFKPSNHFASFFFVREFPLPKKKKKKKKKKEKRKIYNYYR